MGSAQKAWQAMKQIVGNLHQIAKYYIR